MRRRQDTIYLSRYYFTNVARTNLCAVAIKLDDFVKIFEVSRSFQDKLRLMVLGASCPVRSKTTSPSAYAAVDDMSECAKIFTQALILIELRIRI